jgi:hypothetical protein
VFRSITTNTFGEHAGLAPRSTKHNTVDRPCGNAGAAAFSGRLEKSGLSRLAHNQKFGGSNPSPAPNFPVGVTAVAYTAGREEATSERCRPENRRFWINPDWETNLRGQRRGACSRSTQRSSNRLSEQRILSCASFALADLLT